MDTETYREEGHMKTETETGVRQSQAEEPLKPPEAGRRKEGFSPRVLERKCGLADTFIFNFWLPET